MLQVGEARKYQPEDITYQLFGIDPVEFYRSRFACGKGIDNALAIPVLRYEVGYEKIRRLITDLKSFVPEGGRVLDVGCGAAPYAPTLLANVPGIILHGIDMSEGCLKQARSNGVSFTGVFDLKDPLPFDDGYFDAVFSMDLFGHIEFRCKDALIKELARVTRQGGYGHHGVETGYIDYYHCNPQDGSDRVRQYVYIDGHIGTEPAADVCNRFSRYYAKVQHQITYLYPFLTLDAFASLFEEDFRNLVSDRKHPEAVQLALVILGRLNRHFIDLYAKVFGEAFQPNDAPPQQLSAAKEAERKKIVELISEYNRTNGVEFMQVPRELFKPAGFSSITLQK